MNNSWWQRWQQRPSGGPPRKARRHLSVRPQAEQLEGRIVLNFKLSGSFATGTTPLAVVVADVNGDHIPDLITANGSSNTVSVLLGNGNGTFQAARNFAAGVSPQSVAVADINGDGIPDLVVANRLSNTVSVLLGKGNGTFGAAQNMATDRTPVSVVVADVNGDGHPDIITANVLADTLSVLLGNGNGTFQAARSFRAAHGAPPISPYSVAVADVNADGHPDLIAADQSMNEVSVLLGNGDGTFGAPKSFPTGQLPHAVVVADINGDGKLDLVVVDHGSNSVSVLLGTGRGSFTPAQNFATGSFPLAMVATDVNGDGRPDLIVANEGTNKVSVLLGNGNGTFKAAQNYVAGQNPDAVAVADVNGDSLPDLVVANPTKNTVSVLLHQPTRNVPALENLAASAGGSSVAVNASGTQESSSLRRVAAVGYVVDALLRAGEFSPDSLPVLAIGEQSKATGGLAPTCALHVLYGTRVQWTTVNDQFTDEIAKGARSYVSDGLADVRTLFVLESSAERKALRSGSVPS
jgi:hypothetical protein